LITKYGLSKNNLDNEELLKDVVSEIQERTGLSLRKISNLLEINREGVRVAMAEK
jgi:predicted transcriptional regulator